MALNPDLGSQFRKAIHDHWRMFLIEGIVLLVLGAAAIAVPPLAGLAVAFVVGWLFRLGGIMGLIATFAARGAPGFGWALLSAIVALAAGITLLWSPLAGLATLTYVLIFFFILDGILNIVMAIEHRREAGRCANGSPIGGSTISPRGDHHRRAARHDRLGARPPHRDRSPVRRRRADRDGHGRPPRGRVTFR